MNPYQTLLLLWCVVLFACHTPKSDDNKDLPPVPLYSASDGFNKEASHPKALQIADSIIVAMGGYENYNELRYISWTFFGARHLTWDKWTGDVRIEIPSDSSIYLVNLNSMKGKVQHHGEELTQPDSVTKYLQRARAIWINDSYWLVMPFKMKDNGVTLDYLRSDTTQGGIPAHVLELRFKNVGLTPQNKYEIYVDKEAYLVKQWAYFAKSDQDSASAIWPWDNYQSYKNVLLSGDRSDGKGPGDIRVPDSLPETTFISF